MQYGHDLQCLIREVVISDPALGPVHVLKADARYGFYRISLRPTDTPNMGLVFTSYGEDEELVVIATIFCTVTETVEDIANSVLRCNTPALPHSLDDIAKAIVREAPPTLHPVLTGLTRDLYLRRANANPTAYVDIFVGDLLKLDQGSSHRMCQVRCTLLHALDKVFRPCDSGNSANRKEVFSLKKLMSGDCTWSTYQVLLG